MRRRVRSIIAVATAAAAITFGWAAPAAAAEPLEAARAVCNSDGSYYSYKYSHEINPSGTGSARAYLFYSSTNGKYCSITRKYNMHNVKTPLYAGLKVYGSAWEYDTGSYYVYAGPLRKFGKGLCFEYYGYFHNGTAAASYRSPKYCP